MLFWILLQFSDFVIVWFSAVLSSCGSLEFSDFRVAFICCYDKVQFIEFNVLITMTVTFARGRYLPRKVCCRF